MDRNEDSDDNNAFSFPVKNESHRKKYQNIIEYDIGEDSS